MQCRQYAAPELWITETIQGTCPAAGTHISRGSRVLEQAHDPVREGGTVILVDDESGPAVFDDLCRRVAGANARKPAHHGLQIDEPESLIAARHRKRCRTAIRLFETRIVDKAGRYECPIDTDGASLALESLDVLAATNEYELRLRLSRQNAWPGLE
jgi:hypothetical protein